MVLLSVLIALGLIQLWGSGAPLHRDKWFQRWVRWLYKHLAGIPGATLFFSVAGPVLALIVLMGILESMQGWLNLLISIPVLLYCLGRGEFSSLVQAYLEAWGKKDWQEALKPAKQLGADVEDVESENWPDLHQQMLLVSSYRGFERMFAVLFWFILLGPAGALLYRLSALFCYCGANQRDLPLANRWLWLLEWPAVRVLGLSFALTGNFVGCFQQWRVFLGCVQSSSAKVLMFAIRGALVIGTEISLEVSDNELRALQSLLSRTLLLWLCLLALFTLVA